MAFGPEELHVQSNESLKFQKAAWFMSANAVLQLQSLVFLQIKRQDGYCQQRICCQCRKREAFSMQRDAACLLNLLKHCM